MATDYQYARASRVDFGMLRDVLAVALVLLGYAGLVAAAFAVDWRLGLATVSVGLIGTGAYLGYER